MSAFALDRFEVTMSRFARFIDAYDPNNLPLQDAGAPHDIEARGWIEDWNYDRLLPLSSDSIRYEMNCGHQSVAELETDLPVACVTWYLAYAFCIWDGGRLPTEAEWSAAAMAGDQQRIYPWSKDDQDETISDDLAVYSDELNEHDRPAHAGVHPLGAGKHGHEDLAGNLWEWVLDWYQPQLRRGQCDDDINPKSPDVVLDCQELKQSTSRVLKGGSFVNTRQQVQNYRRSAAEPLMRDATIGFRCVRDSAAPSATPSTASTPP